MKERDVLTVDFFPEKTPFPRFNAEDHLKQTAEDMLHLLNSSTASPTAAPLCFGPPILKTCCRTASSSTSNTTTNRQTCSTSQGAHPFSTSEGADHTCPCCTFEGACCHASITSASYFYKGTINETQKCFFSFSDFQLSLIKSTIWHVAPLS
jgi:hypothetical protein